MLVYTVRVSLAIHGSNNLQLSEVSVVCFHRRTYGIVVRRKAEGAHGHWLLSSHTAHEVAPDFTIETKLVNGILIVAGVLSGAAAGWWVDCLKLVIYY